jgi:hypothetical protein
MRLHNDDIEAAFDHRSNRRTIRAPQALRELRRTCLRAVPSETVHRRYVARDPTYTRGVPTAMQKKPCRKWIRAGISRSFRQREAAASACCRLHNQAPEGSACFYWTLICFGFCFCVSVLGMCTVRIPSLLSQRIPSALIFSGSEKLRSKLP